MRWVSIANALANHSYYCFQSIRTTIQVVPLICVCVCVYTRLASFVYMYLCMLMHWKPKFSAFALRLSSLYFVWGRTCDKTCSSFLSLYIHMDMCTVVHKYCIYFALFLFSLLHTSANSRTYTHTHTHNESSHSVIRWLNATKQSGANTRIKYVHFVYVNMFYLRPMLHFVTLHKQ